MPDNPSKNATKTAGKRADGKFAPGNKLGSGRPAGSRNRATLALEALIEGQGEAVVNAMVKAALDGDVGAGRALLDRLVPPRRDRPVVFALPPPVTVADAPRALAAIVAAVASGDLTASEAADLSRLVADFVKVIETVEIERLLS